MFLFHFMLLHSSQIQRSAKFTKRIVNFTSKDKVWRKWATCLLNTQIPLSSLSFLHPSPTQDSKQKFLSPRAQTHAPLHKPQYYLTLRFTTTQILSQMSLPRNHSQIVCTVGGIVIRRMFSNLLPFTDVKVTHT